MFPEASIDSIGVSGLLLEITHYGGIFLFSYDLPPHRIIPIKIKMKEKELTVRGEVYGKFRTSLFSAFDKINQQLQYLTVVWFNKNNLKSGEEIQEQSHVEPSQQIKGKVDHFTSKEIHHVICNDIKGEVFSLLGTNLTPLGFQGYTYSLFAKEEPFQVMFTLNPALPYVEATAVLRDSFQLLQPISLPGNTERFGYSSYLTFSKISEDNLKKLCVHCIENGTIRVPSVDDVVLLSDKEPFSKEIPQHVSQDVAAIKTHLTTLPQVNPKKPEGVQKREYMRALVSLRVSYENKIGEKRTATTRDVSAGGIGIVCDNPILSGSEIPFTLHLPDGWPSISFTGKIAWSYCEEGRCFAGVSFTKIKDEDKALLTRFVYSTLKFTASSIKA